jgi:hypothetical protein
MEGSLKSYLPHLADHVGVSFGALYERQRALVRAHILDAADGRGPGSGVSLDYHTVAYLLIAILATDNLSDTVTAVGSIATAEPVSRTKRCPLTGQRSFVDALAQVLSRRQDLWKVVSVTVDRTRARAIIKYKRGGKSAISLFLGEEGELVSPLQIEAAIDRRLISEINRDLR